MPLDATNGRIPGPDPVPGAKPSVLILYRRPRCRIWKMEGRATATGAAATLQLLAQRCHRGDGSMAIVEARGAEEAREMIARRTAAVSMQLGPNILALGAWAVLAAAGARLAVVLWDERLRRAKAAGKRLLPEVYTYALPPAVLAGDMVGGWPDRLIPGAMLAMDLGHDLPPDPFSYLKARGFN